MPKIEDFLAENEEITDRIQARKHEAVVTDRRLIVHDMEWDGNYLVDAMLSRITSIQAFRKAKPSYLVGSGISFVFGIIFLILGGSSVWAVFIPFFVTIGLIATYFLTKRSGIYVNIDSADPILIEYRGKLRVKKFKSLARQ